jgi:long-chain fatty acid transport protein
MMYKPWIWFGFFYSLVCFFYLPSVHAAAYQIFPTMAYENAAMLNAVNQYTAIIGSTDIVIRLKYVGLVDSELGSAVSDTDTFLPYLRLASRMNPKWVTSFDVSHPLLSNVQYPVSSFVDVAGISAIIIDTNYSPKVSYQVSDSVALGVGFNANNISDAEVALGTPPPNETINKSQGWGYGWDIGLVAQLNESNLLALSYYSQIDFKHLRGIVV